MFVWRYDPDRHPVSYRTITTKQRFSFPDFERARRAQIRCKRKLYEIYGNGEFQTNALGFSNYDFWTTVFAFDDLAHLAHASKWLDVCFDAIYGYCSAEIKLYFPMGMVRLSKVCGEDIPKAVDLGTGQRRQR